MGHAMSEDEVRALWSSLLTPEAVETVRSRLTEVHLTEAARLHLGQGIAQVVSAALGPALGTPLTPLLAAVAAGISRAAAPPQGLPVAEQGLWEEVGADFSDGDAIGEVEGAFAVVYADLVARCVVGDEAMAERLGVDRSRISQRVAQRTLYSFRTSEGMRCFPKWQLAGPTTVQGIEKVFPALDQELHPLTVDEWFIRPAVDLVIADRAVSPMAWLASGGEPAPVGRLAADL